MLARCGISGEQQQQSLSPIDGHCSCNRCVWRASPTKQRRRVPQVVFVNNNLEGNVCCRFLRPRSYTEISAQGIAARDKVAVLVAAAARRKRTMAAFAPISFASPLPHPMRI